MNNKLIIAKIKMINAGIIPARTSSELVSMLESLDRNERRAAQRKFRKIWKKIEKNDKRIGPLLSNNTARKPTKTQKRNRSVVVFQKFIKEEL